MAIIIKKKARSPVPEPLVEPEQPKKAVPGRLLDGQCRMVIDQFPSAMVSWWLMASYAYYIHDTPIISDGLYDEMAKMMLARWDEIQHPHKRLISEDHLRAGSLYDFRAKDYPPMTRGAASHLIQSAWGVSIDVNKA